MRKDFGHAGPFGRLEEGIEYLRRDRQSHRERTFQELVAYWRQLQEEHCWEKLERIVRAGGDQPAQAPPAAKASPTVPRTNGHSDRPAPIAPPTRPVVAARG